MYELNNKVRLIVAPDYMIENSSEFLGFISGIVSQDHDLEQMYLDSFLKIACLEESDITPAITKLVRMSEVYGVDFTLSISLDENELPEAVKEYVAVSL